MSVGADKVNVKQFAAGLIMSLAGGLTFVAAIWFLLPGNELTDSETANMGIGYVLLVAGIAVGLLGTDLAIAADPSLRRPPKPHDRYWRRCRCGCC